MTIEIKNESWREDAGRETMILELASGKHAISVCFSDRLGVWVIVHNAAHRAWRGMGKTFDTAEQAKNNYKTPAVRAMLDFAAERFAGKHVTV